MKHLPCLLTVCITLASVRVCPAQTRAGDDHPIYKDPAAAVEDRVEDLLKRLTIDEKIAMLGGGQFATEPVERLGVPSFRMSDASVGVRFDLPSPAYTASVCLAATWDAALAEKVGASLGRDCRARGVHYLLGPGVNLYRAPMGGRNFEYLGEDPVLAGEQGAAFIRGVQGQGVAATLKHFVANNQEFNRHDLSSDVDERTLRELYLRTFQIALRDGRPQAVMSSYNPINGVHASQNGLLINQVLKGEWGFRGLLMSDWVSTYDTLGMANGGLDLEMPSANFFDADKLQPLLADGRVRAETIDDKIRRQLRVAFEMHWFDRRQRDRSIPHDDPASYAVNVDEARGGITLLKNKGNLLPLDPSKVRHVLVIGPNSDHPVTGGGGSSYVAYSHAVSVLDALTREASPSKAVSRLVWDVGSMAPADGAVGVQAVRDADAVILCVGFDDHGNSGGNYGELSEHEGADRRYALPGGQMRLIGVLAELNPRVIVVLNAGGSVETASWIEHVPALLHAYYPGAEGNTALAEILFGRTNPSGKLPFSWEKRWEDCAAYGNYPSQKHPKDNTYKEGVFLGYRWFDARDTAPLFPFGFGLSYTPFALSDLKATRDGSDAVELSVAVRNNGTRAGAEVVQVYAAPPTGALSRPVRELKAYAKVFLQPGESRTVPLKIRCADLTAWDPADKQWTLFPGEYIFQAGDSSRDLPLRAALKL